jgi:WD40 repeat protein
MKTAISSVFMFSFVFPMLNQVTGSCDNKVRIWRCPVGASSSANQMSSWTTELKESDFSPHTDWVRRYNICLKYIVNQFPATNCKTVVYDCAG